MNLSHGSTSVLSVPTARDLIGIVGSANLPETRRRDLISAVNRICEMAGVAAAQFPLTTQLIRRTVASIKPAAHGVSGKTFATIQSNLRAALVLAGIIDGSPKHAAENNQAWAPLVAALASSQKLSMGLSGFMNYCASVSIEPAAVDDSTVIAFLDWLTARTIQKDPNKFARKVPRLWNAARSLVEGWPDRQLSEVTVGLQERKIAWQELPPAFRSDAEAYLELRRRRDLFDERSDVPARPLAESTLRQQREHIRLAFDILHRADDEPASLAELVEPERVKTVLRHYHERAGGKPNAFAVLTAKTLIGIAKFHVKVGGEQLERLKKIAGRLPTIPYDLTPKNKSLVSAMSDERTLASLLALPDQLLREAAAKLDEGRPAHGAAHAALAIALLLAAPMRSQNLIALNGRRHLLEARGGRGPVRLVIPASETKSGKVDLSYELDPHTAQILRWYRTTFLPAIGADPNGDLFVMPGGKTRGQAHLADLISRAIEDAVGVWMTPHQFRHVAAHLYLRERPDDLETVRQLLGHSFGKTTLIYAGLSGERASRSYGEVVHRKWQEISHKAPREKMKSQRRRKGNLPQ